jgi:hypothetical protein
LYQDKEVRRKSKINEENTFRDSVLEISGFYSNDRRVDVIAMTSEADRLGTDTPQLPAGSVIIIDLNFANVSDSIPR